MSRIRWSIRPWFRSTSFHPLPSRSLSSSLKRGADHVGAEANPLHDVLDVVRQRGDGLPDGREPLGVHERLVVAALLDRDGRLVGDGAGERQVVLGELPRLLAPADNLLQGRLRVEEQHADHLAAALHRHADRLADVVLVQTLHAAKTRIRLGVRDQYALALRRTCSTTVRLIASSSLRFAPSR